MKSCLGENMIFLFGENVTFLTFFVAFDDKNMCLLLKGFGWDLLRIIIIWHLKWLYPMVRLSKMIVSGWESVHWWKGFACLLRSQATSKNSFTKNYKSLNGLCV